MINDSQGARADFENTFELLEAFDRHVVELNSEWMLFRDLFLNPANHPLLDDAGALAWLHLRDALMEDIVMGIGRLLEPATTCGRDNLSIARVMNLPSPAMKPSKETLEELEKVHGEYSAVFQAWRNKRIGHNDLATSLGVSSLPGFSFSDLGQLIERLTNVCTELRERGVDFVPRITARNWVPGLIAKLGGRPLPPVASDGGELD